jgi:propanol-preferring alcohol dehydrogenase
MTVTEREPVRFEPRTGTYRAAVVHGFTEPLVVEDVPRLALEPGQIRVKVEAAGLCHTDIHAAHGDWPAKPAPPFVPGHEGVGIVEELGPDVTEVAIGDRVAMPWLGYACGTCDYCVSGWETLCLDQKNMGYSIDGGFGEYATAYARYVVQVPEGVDPLDAAPLTCAGVTTYKAVKVAGTRSSDLVAVFGVGGLGHLAIQYAQIAGGRVVAVDLFDDKLELARELGAEFRSTRPRKTRSPRSRSSAAPTRRSPWRCPRSRSSRHTDPSAGVAPSSSSRCRPPTRSPCRSSRPC